MPLKKILRKKLTPKGRRIEDASYRLARVSRAAANAKGTEAYNERARLNANQAEYDRRVKVARYEAGYGPGESVDRASSSGSDAYSGSSYRVGRGVPKVREGTNALRTSWTADADVRKLETAARSAKQPRELAARLKDRMGSAATAKVRAARPKSKTARVAKGAIGAAALAQLVRLVANEMSKKKP